MAIPNQIAIDGPAASGKSTVGKITADKLGYLFFDTGVMYRIATYNALHKLGGVQNENEVTRLTQNSVIEIVRNQKNGDVDFLTDGKVVTDVIHSPEVDKNVSTVAAYAGVRASLTEQQRRIGLAGKVVMVGRDIGTVVMPDAELKIYLEASAETRAERRYAENQRKNIQSDYQEILADIRKRDDKDKNRALAPLKPAQDAIIINTDSLSAEEVVQEILGKFTA